MKQVIANTFVGRLRGPDRKCCWVAHQVNPSATICGRNKFASKYFISKLQRICCVAIWQGVIVDEGTEAAMQILEAYNAWASIH